MPCDFCGRNQHDQPCLSLLNLAIFLTNGYGIRGRRGDRCGQQDLGPLAEQRTDESSWNRWSTSRQQQTASAGAIQEEGQQVQNSTQDRRADGIASQVDETRDSTRGHHQRVAPRIGVHVTFESRQREHPSSAPPSESLLAPRQPSAHDATAAPFSAHHDADFGGPHQDPHGGQTDGGTVSGLCSVPFGGQQSRSDNAVPPLGQSASMPSTDGGSWHSDCSGIQERLQHCEADGRQQCDITFSRSQEASGRGADSTAGAVVVDSLPSQQSGASATIGSSFTSRHLATHSGETEAEDIGSTAAGGPTSESHVRYGVVRLFRNPTGKACAANSVVASLAWLMLLSDGFVYELWHSGFELMRNVVSNSLIPLDLMRHGPFGWLLTGEWSIERFLGQQQDASEFCSYLLNFTRPRFLNCSWDNRPSFADGVDSVHLAHEKGSQFSPIKLQFIDFGTDSCQLQDLIHAWHDALGLCRAVTEVGHQLIFAIDRHDLSHSKCLQAIQCLNNRVVVPCFSSAEGDISMDTFELCAVIFHLGDSPFTGHYRAGLRYQGQWLLYDDDALPTKVQELTTYVCCNSCMYWLVRPTVRNVRTMTEAGDHIPMVQTERNPMLTSRW